jgi:ABC-type Mn2+/Zn2+ transport system ATPase subunit
VTELHPTACTAGSDVLLQARGLAVGHGRHAAVAEVDLVLRRGECVALIGPNGSGKTTLFRTLLGILPPLAGEIHYAGAQRRRRPPLGYVPQRDQLDALFPLTVAEVVRMGAFRAWRPFGWHADRTRVAATLTAVGAAGWERRVLAELSGGERQRVLIARALMTDPDLLLLDEPTTGIDAASEEAIFREVDRCRAAGLGILMVSHDVPSLLRVASRALLIRAGRVVEIPAAELLAPERMRELLRGGVVDE